MHLQHELKNNIEKRETWNILTKPLQELLHMFKRLNAAVSSLVVLLLFIFFYSFYFVHLPNFRFVRMFFNIEWGCCWTRRCFYLLKTQSKLKRYSFSMTHVSMEPCEFYNQLMNLFFRSLLSLSLLLLRLIIFCFSSFLVGS